MFFMAGITGKVGGAAARRLLADGHEVRSLVRDRAKAAEWSAKGVELREGSLVDGDALAEALGGVEGAFLMQPTPFAVSPDFPEAKALNAGIVEALRRSPPPRLVVLSSVGSEQASGLGNITQTHMLEEALADFTFPIAIVRAGALLENFLGSPSARRPSVSDGRHAGRWRRSRPPSDGGSMGRPSPDRGGISHEAGRNRSWHGQGAGQRRRSKAAST